MSPRVTSSERAFPLSDPPSLIRHCERPVLPPGPGDHLLILDLCDSEKEKPYQSELAIAARSSAQARGAPLQGPLEGGPDDHCAKASRSRLYDVSFCQGSSYVQLFLQLSLCLFLALCRVPGRYVLGRRFITAPVLAPLVFRTGTALGRLRRRSPPPPGNYMNPPS